MDGGLMRALMVARDAIRALVDSAMRDSTFNQTSPPSALLLLRPPPASRMDQYNGARWILLVIRCETRAEDSVRAACAAADVVVAAGQGMMITGQTAPAPRCVLDETWCYPTQ